MKKTAIAFAMMTLILIGTTVAQPARRIAGSTAMGGGSGVGVKNRQSANLGDTATHEVGHKGKRRNGQSHPNPTGDGTTQHFRKNGISGQNNRTRAPQQNTTNDSSFMKLGDIKGEVINSQPPNTSAKERTETVDKNEYRTTSPANGKRRPAGFVSPSSDPHGKNPTARRKTQNLLPFIEHDNIYKTRNRNR